MSADHADLGVAFKATLKLNIGLVIEKAKATCTTPEAFKSVPWNTMVANARDLEVTSITDYLNDASRLKIGIDEAIAYIDDQISSHGTAKKQTTDPAMYEWFFGHVVADTEFWKVTVVDCVAKLKPSFDPNVATVS